MNPCVCRECKKLFYPEKPYYHTCGKCFELKYFKGGRQSSYTRIYNGVYQQEDYDYEDPIIWDDVSQA